MSIISILLFRGMANLVSENAFPVGTIGIIFRSCVDVLKVSISGIDNFELIFSDLKTSE